MSITNHLNNIQDTVRNTAESCGRDAQDITIMPVTKTVQTDAIIEAINAGYPLIGENKVQEILEKSEALASTPHQTHLIGHLQTNKVKQVIHHVSCIESIDSLKIAQKLQERLLFEDKTMDIFVQVNTSGETSKFGIHPDDFFKLIDEIITMENVNIKGLMTIGAHSDNEDLIRKSFKDLKLLQEKARDLYHGKASFDVLSMGMSHDFRIAIEEGATLLRIGSAIFGNRNYS